MYCFHASTLFFSSYTFASFNCNGGELTSYVSGTVKVILQSNLSYPGALGLGDARNSDLSISQDTIKIHRL